MNWPFGLHSAEMHDWIVDELELGLRTAMALDAERCGYGPLIDWEIDIIERRQAGEHDCPACRCLEEVNW
jgi:hypothetical protein